MPVNSTATGVTATKGFDLARDLIGGLPELEDQIGGAMVGTSGQARAERVSTAVRDLQSFDVSLRDNRAPHAVSPARVGAGTVFSRSIINSRPDNAAPWRVEIEYATGDTVSFDVQFGNRKDHAGRWRRGRRRDHRAELVNLHADGRGHLLVGGMLDGNMLYCFGSSATKLGAHRRLACLRLP